LLIRPPGLEPQNQPKHTRHNDLPTKQQNITKTTHKKQKAALHPDAHPEGGLACNDDALLATQRECILAWIKEVGRAILSGARFNLVNVSFPVRMFEPRSFLQKIADSWVNLELLDRAAAAGERGDPLERMKLVIAWFVAGLSAGVVWRKPFNPILGETWEAEMDMDSPAGGGGGGDGGAAAAAAGEGAAAGTSGAAPSPRRVARLFAEQVSHHPPIAAYVVEGASGGWRFEGHVQPAVEVVVRWYGIRTASRGARRVFFRDGSSIEMFMPAFGVKGVVYSKRPRAEVVGTARLVDARNRLEAVLRFGPAVGAAAGQAGGAAAGGAGARLAALARADAAVGEIYRLRGDAPVVGPSRSGALRMTPSTIGPLDAGAGCAVAGRGTAPLAAAAGGSGGAPGLPLAPPPASASAAVATAVRVGGGGLGGGGGSVAAGTDRADGSYCADDEVDDDGADGESHVSYSSCRSASGSGCCSDEGGERGDEAGGAAAGRGPARGGGAAAATGSAAAAAAAAAPAANGRPHHRHRHHHRHHDPTRQAPRRPAADPRDEAIFAAVAARLDSLAVDGPPPLPMVPSSGRASPARSLTPGAHGAGGAAGGGAAAVCGGSPLGFSRLMPPLRTAASEPLRRSGSAASGLGQHQQEQQTGAASAALGGGGGGTGAAAAAAGSGGGKVKLSAATSLRMAASRLGRLGKSSSKEKKAQAAAAAAAAGAGEGGASAAAPRPLAPSPPPPAAASAVPPSPPSPSEVPLPPLAVHHSASAGRLGPDAPSSAAAAVASAAPSPSPSPSPPLPPMPPSVAPAGLAAAHSLSLARGGGGGGGASGGASALSVPGVAVARIEGSWLSHLNIDHRRYWTLMDPASPYAPLGVAAEKAAAAAAAAAARNGGPPPPAPRFVPRWRSVDRPLPSDCRLREDLDLLAAGDEAESQRWKEVLERRQRHDKKLREEAAAGARGGGGGGGGRH